jgi:hypothetical protein
MAAPHFTIATAPTCSRLNRCLLLLFMPRGGGRGETNVRRARFGATCGAGRRRVRRAPRNSLQRCGASLTDLCLPHQHPGLSRLTPLKEWLPLALF